MIKLRLSFNIQLSVLIGPRTTIGFGLSPGAAFELSKCGVNRQVKCYYNIALKVSDSSTVTWVGTFGV
ncbi:hypothetical protein PHLCEN_2v6262 [Hermanssonia centrifuga]|uniref:Uncharacterized protein n=1 Tax=Hermanssonia centrifuga TaxID=98765 RepID=A0A2R6NZV9_9APHY|nr:hypothetical protein PHLCEN_2v6262 [Hermanssonia centrifuga]